MDFYISASTDVGTKKKINQDSLFVRKLNTKSGKMVFAVLCDGMGGLKYGEIASATVLTAFTSWMYTYLPILSVKPTEEYGRIIKEHWSSIVAQQNDKLRLYGNAKGCMTGSTLTAMLLTKDRYFLLNVGDTRAYEIENEVMQLTMDHTLAAKEIKLGNLTEEQAESSPIQGVLTRCIGVKEAVKPDMFFGEVKSGAVYMLCSDGFRHKVTPAEIKEYLWTRARNDLTSIKSQEEYLIELNKQRGEKDNISVITIAAV